MDCIFCKVIAGELPCTKYYEDDNYLAFKDINPQAKTHILIIPKKHLESFHLVTDKADREIIKGLKDVAWHLIEKNGFNGCKLIMNSGGDHDQMVFHIHLHLLNNG